MNKLLVHGLIGKPIYRKVLVKNPLVVSNNSALIGTIEPNIETITNCSWFVGPATPEVTSEWRTGYLNSYAYSGIECFSENGVLSVYIHFKEAVSEPKQAFAIVEYTKTTD